MILAVTYNNTLYCAIASRRAGRFNMYPAMLYVYLIIIFSIILASFSFSFIVYIHSSRTHRGQLAYKLFSFVLLCVCKCVSEALYI